MISLNCCLFVLLAGCLWTSSVDSVQYNMSIVSSNKLLEGFANFSVIFHTDSENHLILDKQYVAIPANGAISMITYRVNSEVFPKHLQAVTFALHQYETRAYDDLDFSAPFFLKNIHLSANSNEKLWFIGDTPFIDLESNEQITLRKGHHEQITNLPLNEDDLPFNTDNEE